MATRWTPETEAELRRRGWRPGRLDTLDYATALRAGGWETFPEALGFLQEFGGLTLSTRSDRQSQLLGFLRLRRGYEFSVGGEELVGDAEKEFWLSQWNKIVQAMGTVCPLGTYPGQSANRKLWMNQGGQVFHHEFGTSESIFLLGSTPDAAVETVSWGYRDRHWRSWNRR